MGRGCTRTLLGRPGRVLPCNRRWSQAEHHPPRRLGSRELADRPGRRRWPRRGVKPLPRARLPALAACPPPPPSRPGRRTRGGRGPLQRLRWHVASASEALRALGERARLWALDFEPCAVEVYKQNFPRASAQLGDVLTILDGRLHGPLSTAEETLKDRLGTVDLVLGGPPCQGHSDLNNRTRNRDDRNQLYLRMVRAAKVLEPDSLLINVPGALRDRSGALSGSSRLNRSVGWDTPSTSTSSTSVGWESRNADDDWSSPRPRSRSIDLASIESRYAMGPTDVAWAMNDLVGVDPSTPVGSAASAEVTRRRIDFLFDHDLYELPDEQRPPCHAEQDHSYASVYGRLRWDEPSQTVTRGFYSMCTGRYVHPGIRRTLTAHEAARLQFFPDSFDFSAGTKRNDLACLIANAVPMR